MTSRRAAGAQADAPRPHDDRSGPVSDAEVVAVVERQWPRLVARRSTASTPPSDVQADTLAALAHRLAVTYAMTEAAARGEIDTVRKRLILAHRARRAAG